MWQQKSPLFSGRKTSSWSVAAKRLVLSESNMPTALLQQKACCSVAALKHAAQ